MTDTVSPIYDKRSYDRLPHLRFIGDVHGGPNMSAYLRLAYSAHYTVQVGDLGFEYEKLALLDPRKHKVVAGNHDNYEKNEQGIFVKQTPHFLGDFGTHAIPGFGEFFFVRGENSIDRKYRVFGRNWWYDEELFNDQANAALEAYTVAKPRVVVSHGCPTSVIPAIVPPREFDGVLLKPSKTAHLLDAMLAAHAPELWIFGHYHVSVTYQTDKTLFRCLNELETLNFPEFKEAPVKPSVELASDTPPDQGRSTDEQSNV